MKTLCSSNDNSTGRRIRRTVAVAVCDLTLVGLLTLGATAADAVDGWLNWRGPEQNGTSRETNVPVILALDDDSLGWTFDLAGRGTPVIAGDRLYAIGYRGNGPDLQEVIACLDANTGAKLWEYGFNDFLSDIIYDRYAIGSPAIDPESGNVYIMTSAGIIAGFTRDGTMLWQHSMMEAYGRLTFPNGRTGAPMVVDELVIFRGITTNWGREGPARDRFYAFHKVTGKPVWSSTPGIGPKDSSFSTPVLGWLEAKRVFYCGTGCGNVVCVNARTGDPIWRYQISYGGVNSSVLLSKNNVIIAIHGKENLDSSEIGRMVAVRGDRVPIRENGEPVVFDSSRELWRSNLAMFTSSPILVDDRVYQVDQTGHLACIDAASGKILWKLKLGNSQLHASPVYAAGHLYVPMLEGAFFVIRLGDQSGEIVSEVQLSGNCLGAPIIWSGQVYVHTTEKLYCFKNGRDGVHDQAPVLRASDANGRTTPTAEIGPSERLLIVPCELLLRPAERVRFELFGLDGNGFVSDNFRSSQGVWTPFIPPAAKVRVTMNAAFHDDGVLVAGAENEPSAGAFKVVVGDQLSGEVRGRIMPDFPIKEDFESYELVTHHPSETGVQFAYPPLPWIGARFKWEIRDVAGAKALAKTLDRLLFQRTMTFIGHPDMSNYTMQADVMSEGNRRMMSTVGVINQRYIIALNGNWQRLDIVSNYDRVNDGVAFSWKPGTWYTLKSRVDCNGDGSGIVRAKAWPRYAAEPADWLIEYRHRRAHAEGSPGLFGFSPQSQFRVYIDNIHVTKN